MLILVVEDEPAVREVLAMVLEHEGHSVIRAADGLEALQAVEEHRPDKIILDLWMPGMDGWEFLHRLRSRYDGVGNTPVIAVSADFRAATQDLPIESFLLKPVEYEKLVSAVREGVHQT